MASGVDAKESPAEYLMRRLRAEFGLEFVHAKLSDRGRFKVLDYAKTMLKWEEEGPKKVREIDRLLAKKGPGLLSRKFPASGDHETDTKLADENDHADEMSEVEDLVVMMNGHGEPVK